MKNTKIVATISDIRCEPDFLKSLYEQGMNVVRLNTAHMTPESAMPLIESVRKVSDKLAILVDTKGPEIRTRLNDADAETGIPVAVGDLVELSGILNRVSAEGRKTFGISYDKFHTEIPVGTKVLVDDGETEFTVVEKHNDYVLCQVENEGKIKKNKSINTPGFTVNLPSISEKDHKFIEFAAEAGVDFIAHSFVRNAQDVIDVQKILDKYNSPIKIIAKIENLEGVERVDEILDHAYGVMVARGDLGIEVPAEKIPGYQRHLIERCVIRKKPVIVATQMLHTMIDNPRPTRAEVSDIANAIYSNTDAIMLSGETTYGAYPIEAVKIMNKIALEVEKTKEAKNSIAVPAVDGEPAAFLAEAAYQASKQLEDVKAIVTNTKTGKTARYLAAFRGEKKVYAQCYDATTARQLSLSYGVYADVFTPDETRSTMVSNALKGLTSTGVVKEDDKVVYIGGSFGIGGGSTFMEISEAKKLIKK
ncbi:MAG: pyruvate kinase [Mangrovibacterium sp.]